MVAWSTRAIFIRLESPCEALSEVGLPDAAAILACSSGPMRSGLLFCARGHGRDMLNYSNMIFLRKRREFQGKIKEVEMERTASKRMTAACRTSTIFIMK